MPKKPSTRNELYAALTALVNDGNEELQAPPGFKTVKQFEDIFGVGQRQTYIYLERLTASGLSEKKSFRILLGFHRRTVPHYKLHPKAHAIVRKLKGGR
jgi:hypothetical protein